MTTVSSTNANPNWIATYVEKNELVDETAYLQIGQEYEQEYFRVAADKSQASVYDSFPTKDKKDALYKLTSLWLELS